MNIKEGFRRIILVFAIFVSTVLLLFCLIDFNHNINWTYKNNIRLEYKKPDIANKPIDDKNDLIYKFECSPFKNKCMFNGKEVTKLHFVYADKKEIEVILPGEKFTYMAAFKYIISGIFTAILSFSIIYFGYLLVEKIIIWIKKGFQKKEDL